MTSRREAAAKIAANVDVVAKRIVARSGVVRSADSPLGAAQQEAAYLAEAKAALQRVGSFLVTDAHPAEPPAESAAVQVAMLAYFRNLASSPRDMTASAVEQLRMACDAVIQNSYLP